MTQATVIGGGPAGRIAALRLAAGGAEVRLVDRRNAGLGGQCLHHGCMVICALNDAARHSEDSFTLHSLGILNCRPEVSWSALMAGMREIQATITDVISEETTDAGVEVVHGTATVDGRRVLVDGRETEEDAVLIATGSRPKYPAIPGADLSGVYNPHTITKMPHLPGKVAIIGGGVIAAEYAYIFSRFGADVTLLCRSTLLRSLPEALRRTARHDLSGVKILEGVKTEKISRRGGGLEITFAGEGEDLSCGAVLVATGLVPNTEGIFGQALGGDGQILVNERMQTSVPGVYAAGDVTGGPYLTPEARREGRAAADAILGKSPMTSPEVLPQAVKLRNDHAWCGMPKKGTAIPGPAGPGSFWRVPERGTGMGMIDADKESGILRGMAAAGPSSSTAAAYCAYLINRGVSLDEMEALFEVHPSTDAVGWLLRYCMEERKNR